MNEKRASAPIRHSIIIITYRRDDCLQEALAILKGMVGARPDVELVLVDNNADGADRAPMLSGFRNSVYVDAGTNLGVAGGRNLGIQAAHGAFLTFLDDDALVQESCFLDIAEEHFRTDKILGIIAAKSVNFYTGKIDRREFPHTDKARDPDQPFYTHRFIGVGHVIRAELFQTLGLYDADFFYGSEEFDFSYRAINAGWRILYEPRIWLSHKQASSGRLPAKAVVERQLLNKLKVSYRHLPTHLLFINAAAWIGYTMLGSRPRVNPVRPLAEFWRWQRANKHLRRPLGRAARAYAGACGATLWK